MDKSLHILIVEDNPGDTFLLSDYLSICQSFKVTYDNATTIAEAEDCLFKSTYDLILLDLGLPDSTGIDSFLAIRNCSPDTPIIILSISDSNDLALNCIHKGAQDYLVKGKYSEALLEKSIQYAIFRKKSEKALAQSHKSLTDFKASIDAISIFASTDVKGNITAANENFCKISGYHKKELIGQNHRILKSGHHPTAFYREMWHTIANGKIWRGEVKNKTKDGQFYWVDTTILPILNAQKKPTAYYSLRNVITERKEAEAKLKKSEKENRAIIEAIPDILYQISADGQYLNVHCENEEDLPDSTENMIGKNISNFLPEKAYPKVMQYAQKCLKTGKTQSFHYARKNKEGKQRHFQARMSKCSENSFLVITRDITEEQRHANRLKQLLQQNSQLAFAINHVDTAVCITKAHGAIEWINQTFSRQFQADITQVKNQAFCTFINRFGIGTSAIKCHETFLNQNITHQVALALPGGEAWYELKVQPIQENRAETKSYVIFINDISARKRWEDALVAQKEKAEKATAAKSAFLSNMSHEIRTPLNAVLGITELLEDTATAAQKENLSLLRFSSENLLALINDILDFNKIEAGKIEIDRAYFNFEDSLQQLVKTLNHKATEKGIKLLLNIDKAINPYILGDRFRLNQVLTNLIANAIKFTAKGYVEVKITLQEKTEKNQLLHISVKDTGIGIPKDRQQQIFEDFTQADKGISRKFGGTGLGLSISRKLLKLMNSCLHVESNHGEGSTFYFLLSVPYQTQNLENKLTADKFTINRDFLQGKKILIVDDNKVNLLILKKMLKRWDLEVTDKASAQEAISAAKQQCFDLILMDIEMPEMDGFEASKQIRMQSQNQTTPIIAATANTVDEMNLTSQNKAATAGIQGVLTKPIVGEKLFETLCRYLHKVPDVAKELPIEEVKDTSKTDPITENFQSQLLAFSDGDETLVKELRQELRLSLQETKQEVIEALAKKDAPKLHSIKHKMSWMTESLGLQELRDFLDDFITLIEKSKEKSQLGDFERYMKKIIAALDD